MDRALHPTEILTFEPRLDLYLDFETTTDEEPHRDARKVASAIGSRTICPYCRSQLGAKAKEKAISGNAWYDIRIKHCDNCGWWCADQACELMEGPPLDYTAIKSVLKKFRVGDLDVPIRDLREHLKKRPEALLDLHPRKFEELIASVFSDHFKCEVELTARTRDGGIDMYLIRTDGTYLVQAKRRSGPRSVEGVQVVRELAGVLLISGYSKGIVVTTAEDFSKPARKAALSSFLENQGYSIELINGRHFLETLQVAKSRDAFVPPWHELLVKPIESSSMKYL
jgi:restriction system protein